MENSEKNALQNLQKECSKLAWKGIQKSISDVYVDPHFIGSDTRRIIDEKLFKKTRKPKPNNYNTELKIRISSKQKDALAKISSSYGLTMSQYVRELIEKDLYND